MIRTLARRAASALSSQASRAISTRGIAIQPIKKEFPPLLVQSRPFSSTLRSELEFEKAADETLESLCERLEELIDDHDGMDGADVNLSSGVLTLELPEEHGTFVINKQTPNQQIWLSSPQSGPARFDFVPEEKKWVYSRTKESLHAVLEREVGENVLKQKANFEGCFMGGSDQ